MVDSLSAIFKVLLAMVVSMSFSGAVEANENWGAIEVFSSVVNLKDQFLLVRGFVVVEVVVVVVDDVLVVVVDVVVVVVEVVVVLVGCSHELFWH